MISVKVRAQAIQDINARFDGTYASIKSIRPRLQHHGLTPDEWKGILEDANVIFVKKRIEHFKVNQNAETSAEMQRFFSWTLFASRHKKLDIQDIGKIMNLVREIG